MWATYFREWDYLLIQLVLLVPITLLGVWLLHIHVLPFCAGFILVNPFSYYFGRYRTEQRIKQKRLDEEAKR